MTDCIFCKIVKGELPATKIAEDADVLAFLDIHPEGKGHCLVIPKTHAKDITEISESDLCKVMNMAKHLAEKAKDRQGADGVLLRQANGKSAGQAVMHFHMHVIPKYAGQ